MTTTIFEADESTFERDVLERSRDAPVVVDFWAAWCAPCRALGPILERLAAEADGAWTLAKVDVDANPRLAAAFGIQGIPAVKAFKDGRQVAEFTGALPEPQVRTWLAQLGPTPAEVAFERGRRLEADAEVDGARAAYRETLDHDPGHADARAALARLEARVRAEAADEDELRRALAADPTDVDAATKLADVEAVRGDLDAAFDSLLDLVRSLEGEPRETARKHLLTLLDSVPADDPRALRARRSLAAALF